MNKVKLILTMIVIFLLANFSGYFIHSIWLKPDYLLAISQYPNLFRPDGQEKILPIVLAYISFAVGSVWVYTRGVEDKPWLGQGIRFGILMFLILTVPMFLINYAVQPVPTLLMSKQILCELIDKIFLGIVIALMCGKSVHHTKGAESAL